MKKHGLHRLFATETLRIQRYLTAENAEIAEVLATKRHKVHKREQKMTKKVLYLGTDEHRLFTTEDTD